MTPSRRPFRLLAIASLSVLITLWTNPASAARSAKIIGGTEVTSPSDYPWQVALLRDRADVYQSQYCGGTILSDRWILTAAHCIEDTMYVAAGIIDLNNAQAGEVVKVAEAFVHPNYASGVAEVNDIALLRLEEPLDLARCGSNCMAIDTVTPSNEATVMYENALAIVTGWGDRDNTGTDDYPVILHSAEVQIVPCAGTGYSDTSVYADYPITHNMICAGTPEYSRDTCQGDSGGPLVVFDADMTPLLGGITSWGKGCAIDNFPGVYTRVAMFQQWITDTIENNCCAPATVLTSKISNSKEKKDEFLGGMEWWLLLGLAGLWWRRGLSRR